jgi:hypothetical protein
VLGTLTFNAGESSKGFEVPLINDRLPEGSETVLLSLNQPVGALLGAKQAVLTITDQTPPPAPPPNPFISELVPYSVPVNFSLSFPVRVVGTGFDETSAKVIWNNSTELTIVSRSATELIVTMNPSLWNATAGTYPILVRNPGNIDSNAAPFMVDTVEVGTPPPFVVQDPMADPNPTYTRTTRLTVKGGTFSAGGESVLSYDWEPVGSTPFAYSFSANKSHAANDMTATFNGPGVYHFRVMITDTVTGFSVVTQALDVTVISKAASLTLTPKSQTITPDQTLTLMATVKDQFGAILNPTLLWSSDGGNLVPRTSTTKADLSVDAIVSRIHITAALSDKSLSDYADVTVINGSGGVGSINQAVPAPVPYKSSSGLPGVTFKHLVPGTQILIYTIDGHLVETIHSDDGSDQLWKLNNSDGSRVSSGVYLYIINGAGQEKDGKLVLIL